MDRKSFQKIMETGDFDFFYVMAHGSVRKELGRFKTPNYTFICQTGELGDVTYTSFVEPFARLFYTDLDIMLTERVLYGDYGSGAEHVKSGISKYDRYLVICHCNRTIFIHH